MRSGQKQTKRTAVLFASAKEVLTVAVSLSGGMAECGADIHRAEDTAARICSAFGYGRAEIFCVTSFLSITVVGEDGVPVTASRRLLPAETDLHRLERLNALSRQICGGKIPLSQAQAFIDRIRQERPYAPLLLYAAAMLASAAYAVYFGGDGTDALCAALVGLLSELFARRFPKSTNVLLAAAARAGLTGVISAVLVQFGIGTNASCIFIGALLLMTPGLTLATSLRDLLGGDTISGMTRMLTAVLTALATAGGIAAAMALTGGSL